MNRSPHPILGLVVLLFCSAATMQQQSGKVFSDGDFADADWALSVMSSHPGGSAHVEHMPTGGNPDAFRRVLHDLPAASNGESPRVVTLHRRIGATYDPSVEGAIEYLCYEEDVRTLQGFGDGQSTGPVLWQSGRVYLVASGFTGSSRSWTQRQATRHLQDDFYEIFPDLGRNYDSHPDFSSAGEPITFGFLRANTSRSGGFVMDGAIDNWRIELDCGDDSVPIETPSPTSSPTPPSTPTITATETATPTENPTATATGTPTPTRPPSPSPTAIPPTPVAFPDDCVCEAVLRGVPRAVVIAAVDRPESVLGWRQPLNPNKPVGPDNPLRVCLNLSHPAQPYHPMWNGVVWKVGCR